MAKCYHQYYLNQCGEGLSHIGSLYISPRVVQQGRGIGNFFSGLFNYIKPLLISGINALKNQAAETGKAVINDLGRKPLRNIIQEQSKIALHNLSDKAINKITKLQNGKGKRHKKRRPRKKRSHLTSKQGRKHTHSKKSRKKSTTKFKISDIFSKSK